MIRKTLFWTFVSIVYAFVTWTGLFAIPLPGDIVLSRSTPDPIATCFQALHGRGVGFPLVAYSESGRNSCDSTKALNVFAVIIDLAIFLGLPPQQAIASGKLAAVALSLGSLQKLHKAKLHNWRVVAPIMILAAV